MSNFQNQNMYSNNKAPKGCNLYQEKILELERNKKKKDKESIGSNLKSLSQAYDITSAINTLDAKMT